MILYCNNVKKTKKIVLPVYGLLTKFAVLCNVKLNTAGGMINFYFPITFQLSKS